MTTVTIENARAELEALIDKALESHEPIFITSRRGDAVLLAEDDWRAILESLHLASLPAMGNRSGKGWKPISASASEN